MQSRNVGYIPAIDQLRFFAALLVFAFHFFHTYKGGWSAHPEHAWAGLITEGYTGVSLFFVLSGFIFTTIAEGGPIAYRSFLRNRLLRIAPLFLAVFLVAISIHRDRFVATDLFYIFVTNIGNPPTSWHFITGVSWSISVEFTFYLLFPFLAAFAAREGAAYLVKLLLLLLVVKVGAYLATDNSKLMLYSTLVGRLDQFLIGMLAAMAYRKHQQFIHLRARVILWLGAVLTLLAVAVQARYASYFLPQQKDPFWTFWGTVEASCWALVIIGFVGSRFAWNTRLGRAVTLGGTWSFSIYMWHALIIFTMHELLGSIGGTGFLALLLNGLVVLAAVLAFAWLSFTVIERPFLRMRGQYVDPPKARIHAAP
jgi:peptidoglycan/LPS O-acetylase OafA/YrhL